MTQVLVDPLPAIGNELGAVQTVLQGRLPQAMLTACHLYLHPMGMMHNIFSSTIFSLFSDATRFNLEGGLPVNGSVPFQVITKTRV